MPLSRLDRSFPVSAIAAFDPCHWNGGGQAQSPAHYGRMPSDRGRLRGGSARPDIGTQLFSTAGLCHSRRVRHRAGFHGAGGAIAGSQSCACRGFAERYRTELLFMADGVHSGPVAGGLLYGLGASVAYSVALVLFIVSAMLAVTIRKPEQRGPAKAISLETMLAGFKFISQEKWFSAPSRSIFCCVARRRCRPDADFRQGSADTRALGLGLLRAAPGIGAITVAVILAFRPIRHHAGLLMFVGVGFSAFPPWCSDFLKPHGCRLPLWWSWAHRTWCRFMCGKR